jgi:regulatory protein
MGVFRHRNVPLSPDSMADEVEELHQGEERFSCQEAGTVGAVKTKLREGLGLSGVTKGRQIAFARDAEQGVEEIKRSLDVPGRPIFLNQPCFEQARFEVTFAEPVVNSDCLLDDRLHFGVFCATLRIAVLPETAAEVFRFTDINETTGQIVDEIDAWCGGQGGDKLFSEFLVESLHRHGNPSFALIELFVMREKPREPAKVDSKSLAMHRISVREYGAGELRSYLKRKGVPAAEAEQVVEDLIQRNLLDDVRYARVIARHHAFRSKGPDFVLMKLRQKGVSLTRQKVQEIFREVLPEAAGSELEMARRVIERKYPKSNVDQKEKSKAYGALARRGFSRDVIMKAFLVPEPEESPEELPGKFNEETADGDE